LIIQCPSCNSRFSIDSAKISSPSSKGRCSVCGHVFPLLEHAVEDMEVAELRDRFESEKAEKARKAIGFYDGVYGKPRVNRKREEKPPFETEREEMKELEDEPFPSLDEEITEEEIPPFQEAPEESLPDTARRTEEAEQPQTSSKLFEEEDVGEWAETVFPEPEEDEEAAGWEGDLAKEIEESMKPGEPARQGTEPDIEPEIGIQATLGTVPEFGDEREREDFREEEPPVEAPIRRAPTAEPLQRMTDEEEKGHTPGPLWEEEGPERSFEEAFPSEKESRGPLSFRFLLLLLIVLALGGGGWYLYKTGTLTSPGSMTTSIMARINALRGKKSMVLFDLKNEQEPAADGKLFAVRGMVQNKGSATVAYVPLRIKIFDGQGHVLLTGRAVAGKVLTPEEISKMTVKNVLKTYRDQNEKNRQTSGRLEPGGKLPFLFLFDLSKFPRKTAKTFQVEVLKGS